MHTEQNFEWIYRWEKTPIETINKLDHNQEGFLINQILYEDMIQWLSMKEIKEIKIEISYIINKLNKDEPVDKIINISNNIVLYIKNKKEDNWFRHKWSIVINIKNKKYFLKIVSPLDKLGCDINWNFIPASNEYQWIEYIYKNHPNVNLIKPVLSYDDDKIHVIIYPFVENMNLLSDIYEKYWEAVYNKIILENPEIEILKKDEIVDDIYSKNMRINKDNHKIYIFDPIYISSDNIYHIQ